MYKNKNPSLNEMNWYTFDFKNKLQPNVSKTEITPVRIETNSKY
jgi:hypothetical protein